MSVGQDLLNVPFPEMVSELAIAIAKSQYKLDSFGVEMLKVMGNRELAPVHLPNIKVEGTELVDTADDSFTTSMIGAGFQPTFYQFTDTIIEVKMDITMEKNISYERDVGTKTNTKSKKKSGWWSRKTRSTVSTTTVNAKYANTYSYKAEGSSLLRTKITPVPPNSFVQRVLDMKSDAMRMNFELKMLEAEKLIEEKRKALEDKIDKDTTTDG